MNQHRAQLLRRSGIAFALWIAIVTFLHAPIPRANAGAMPARLNLPAAESTTWTGAISTDWNTPGNWSSDSVPLCSTDVLIPINPSGGRFPALTAESWVGNLTIQSGATLTAGSQTLHVCGNWVNYGTFNRDTSTVTFDRAGSQTVSTYTLGSYTSNSDFPQSFEDAFQYIGWSESHIICTNIHWWQSPSSSGTPYSHGVPPGGGRSVARFNSFDAYGCSTRMYRTTPLNLTGYYGNRVRFFMYHDTSYIGDDRVQVEVSTDGGKTFQDVGTPFYRRIGTTGWTENTVDLSAYDNLSSVIVSFKGISGNGGDCFIDLVVVEGATRAITDSTFYNLEIAPGSTLVTSGNISVTNNLTIQQAGMLDVNTNKVSVSGSYNDLSGWLSNNETKPVGTTPVDFSDGRNLLSAKLTLASGSSNYTVTTHAGWVFPQNDYGTTCPLVDNAVWRTYNIVPATPASTTVRLYYQDSELNGNPEDTLKVYHCSAGSWHEQTDALTRDPSANWVQISGVTDFSPFILSSSVPTAVDLARFAALPNGSAVRLEWETANEIDNLGFNLYRANEIDGVRLQLNSHLITSLVPPGSPFGASYTFMDKAAEVGKMYSYWLEDVDVNGKHTLHPAVAVDLAAAPKMDWRIFLPGVWSIP